MNKTVLIALTGLALMVGCATGTHIVTGTPHPKIKPTQVVLYQIPPAKYEIIGIVNASTPGMRQRNMDDVVNQLKKQAADIGANGIILGSVVPGTESLGTASGTAYGGGRAYFGSAFSSTSTGIQLSGQAVFVDH